MSALLAFCALGAFAQPVEEQTPERKLESARNRFEFGDCDGAKSQLIPIATPEVLKDEAKLVDAYRMLGVCAGLDEDRAGAAAWFRKLLYIDLEHRLDLFRTPPPIVDLLESVRREIRDEKQRIEDATKKDTPEKGPAKFVVVERERVTIQTPLSTSFVPFGVPQFASGRTAVGSVVGATQGLALAVNIGALLAFSGFDLQDGKWDGRPTQSLQQEQAMQGAQLTAALASVALGLAYGYGVADALWNHEGSREMPVTVKKREVDEEEAKAILKELAEPGR